MSSYYVIYTHTHNASNKLSFKTGFVKRNRNKLISVLVFYSKYNPSASMHILQQFINGSNAFSKSLCQMA